MKKSIQWIAVWVLILGGFYGMRVHHQAELANAKTELAQPVFEKIRQTRVIDCAYFVWPPYVMKEPNTGALTGLNVDQMSAMAQALGVTVNWKMEVGLDQIAPALAQHKADMMCATLWASSNRSWELDFSNPTHYTPLYAMVRADDDRFDGHMEKINDPEVTVVFIDGDSPQAVANARFPKARQLALPNASDGTQNLLSVLTHKADVTFVDKYLLSEFEKAHPGKIRAVSGISPVQVFGETFAVTKGETKLRDMLNVVIFELQNNGAMDGILKTYGHGAEVSIHANMDHP